MNRIQRTRSHKSFPSKNGAWRFHSSTGPQDVADTPKDRKEDTLGRFDRGVDAEASNKDNRRVRRALGAMTAATVVATGAPVVAGAIDRAYEVITKRTEADMSTPEQQQLLKDWENRQLNDNPSETTVTVEMPKESFEAQVLNGNLPVAYGYLDLPAGSEFLTEPRVGGDAPTIHVPEGRELGVLDPVRVETENGTFYTFTIVGEYTNETQPGPGSQDFIEYEPFEDAAGEPVWPAYWVPEGVGEFRPMEGEVAQGQESATYTAAFGFSVGQGHGGPVAQGSFSPENYGIGQ